MCYMSTAKRVGVRELRQNLSVHLARVIAGETLEVTDRGQPVAVLAPLAAGEPALSRLQREGRLVPAVGDCLSARRRPTRAKGLAARELRGERADRRL
jgi:prevent-host-death family protein